MSDFLACFFERNSVPCMCKGKKEDIMKIFKWNIDKTEGSFGCKLNKVIPNRVVSYKTLSGEQIVIKSSKIRKKQKLNVCNGRVVGKFDLT